MQLFGHKCLINLIQQTGKAICYNKQQTALTDKCCDEKSVIYIQKMCLIIRNFAPGTNDKQKKYQSKTTKDKQQ